MPVVGLCSPLLTVLLGVIWIRCPIFARVVWVSIAPSSWSIPQVAPRESRDANASARLEKYVQPAKVLCRLAKVRCTSAPSMILTRFADHL